MVSFYNINPLEILVDDSIKFNAETTYYRHTGILKKFFTLLLGIKDSPNQDAELERSLHEIYNNFGIKPKDAKTWHPAKPPLLTDLRAIWERDKDNNVSAKALFDKSIPFDYSWKFLSTPTNVDLSKKIIIIDISGVPDDLTESMNYLLTAVLSLRFNISAKQKTTIYIDEGRVFLKNPKLADDIVTYLTQARSYGIRLVLATQHVSDIKHVSNEFRTNTFIDLIFGNNIWKDIKVVRDYYNLNSTDTEYLKNCNQQGQALLLVGPPYSQSYHIQMKLSPLEREIILGEKATTDMASLAFLNAELKQFSDEQGVIFSEWVDGGFVNLNTNLKIEKPYKAVGSGGSAYVILTKPIPSNQTPEHFFTITYIGGWLLQKKVKITVNHFGDVDLVGYFPCGEVAFEYQTAGNNDTTRLLQKRQKSESQRRRVFFIGNSQSVTEMKKALNDDKIIVGRGKELEDLLNQLINEKPNPD